MSGDFSPPTFGPCANQCTLTIVLIGCMLPGRKWGGLFPVPIVPIHDTSTEVPDSLT